MTRTAPPVVAVVPFGAGAEDDDPRVGQWARQLARRMVERFSGDEDIDLRPLILVAAPGSAPETGYLVLGSAPEAAKAAEYARAVGASHAVTGTYSESAGRRLAADLIDVASGRVRDSLRREVAAGELHLTEPALAAWLVGATGAPSRTEAATAAAANESAYAALLEAMDAELDATLLRQGDPKAATSALARAAAAYAAAVRADPASTAIEEHVLVLAAAAIENDEQATALPAVEALAEATPRSWRAHYILGELRRTSGDVGGAIVAFEHSDALRPLRATDVLALARLYVAAGAPAVAASRLRRVIDGETDRAVVATARRLRLGLKDPSLERDLERAGEIAVAGDASRADEAEAAFARVLAADPELWEAHFGRGLLARLRGDAAAADAAFRRAVEIDPDAAELVEEVRRGG